MNKFLSLLILLLAFSVAALAQGNDGKTVNTKKDKAVKTEKTEKTEKKEMAKPTDKDKTEAIPTDGVLKRGAALSDTTEMVALADVLMSPAKYTGKTVRVEGVIVRSCKMEGCWLELAPDKDAKSVRVRMKDHAFFVPLDSAGASAKAEGTFIVKTLSKEEVEHQIKDDGAKFENRNADGSVTEITFEATGVELTRKS